MKVLKKAYRPGPSAEKIIEDSRQASMETRLATSPNVVDSVDAAAGNYNFIMAVVLRQMRKGNMPRDAVVDVLFKSGELFKTSYRMVMGKDAVLPPYSASGGGSVRPVRIDTPAAGPKLPATVPPPAKPKTGFKVGDYIWWEDGRGHAVQAEYMGPSKISPGMHVVQLGDGRRIRASLSHLSEENPY